MKLLKMIVLGFSGMSFGFLASAGVFTVLVAVGLVPRFAGKTHTAGYILLYEEFVIWGTICGMLFSIFESVHQNSKHLLTRIAFPTEIIFGFFTGCFVGCLALSIAEMLDSVPIFSRRIRMQWGIGVGILFVALGKMVGAMLYYICGIGMGKT